MYQQEQVRVLTGQLEKAKYELQTPAAEPTRESLLQQKAALEKELMASHAKRVDAQVDVPVSLPSFGASKDLSRHDKLFMTELHLPVPVACALPYYKMLSP